LRACWACGAGRREADAQLSDTKLAHAQEIVGLRRDLDAMRTEMVEAEAASDAVCAMLEADNSRLTRELEILRRKEARLTDAEQAVRAAAEERRALEGAIDGLRKECSAASASVAQQRSKLSVAEARAIAAEVQVEQLAVQIVELRGEHSAKLRTSSTEREAVEREHRATKERLEEARPVIDTLAAEKRRLAKGLDALRTVHQEHLEAAAKEREEAQQQHYTLKENVTAAEKRIEAAVRDLAALECENERLRTSSSQMQTAAGDTGSLKLKLTAAEEALANARAREQELEDALATVVLNSQKPDAKASSPARKAPANTDVKSQKSDAKASSAAPKATTKADLKSQKPAAKASSPARTTSPKTAFEKLAGQRTELQRIEQAAELIFKEFDVDGDGYHSLDDARSLARVLTNSDVNESDFEGLCGELGANPADGLNLQQFTTIYTDSAFGADALKDYRKIFGKPSPR
jgi:DNA repair exonuclease SbcCD ATPase subunit